MERAHGLDGIFYSVLVRWCFWFHPCLLIQIYEVFIQMQGGSMWSSNYCMIMLGTRVHCWCRKGWWSDGLCMLLHLGFRVGGWRATCTSFEGGGGGAHLYIKKCNISVCVREIRLSTIYWKLNPCGVIYRRSDRRGAAIGLYIHTSA